METQQSHSSNSTIAPITKDKLPTNNSDEGEDEGPGESESRRSEYEVNNSMEDEEKQDGDEEAIDEVPDGGRGWLVVLAVFLLNLGTWGANSGFAIYLAYDLNNNVFEGASKFDYALIGGFAFGLALLFCPFINYLQGIVGTRGLILIGNVFQFLGVFLASYAKTLWELYITQGLMNSIGLAFIALPSLTLLPQWFKKKRTFASGIGTAGSGIGGIIFNLGMQKIVDRVSVHWALRAQSLICAGVVLIALLFVKTRIEKKLEFTVYDVHVLQCAGFYMTLCFIITCILGYVIVLYTLVSSTISLGYTANQGSIVAAMVQLGSFLGRPVVGLVADRFGTITVGTIIYTLCAIFTYSMWIPASNYATLICYGIIIGLTMGSVYSMTPVICARLVGIRKMNVCFSMVWISMAAAGICSPVIGVALATHKGHDKYLYTTVFAATAFAVAALSLLLLRGYINARDEIAAEAGDEDDIDMGQLKYTVPFHLPFRHLFNLTRV